MFWPKKKRRQEKSLSSQTGSIPTIPVTLSQVKKAVQEFERKLPKGINRTVLIKEKNEIDFRLLVSFLGGMPDSRFYMSREAYEIYTEEDRLIPYWLDIVQRAVDNYVEEWKEPPIVPNDARRKISYVILQKKYWLKDLPPIDFYLTPYDNLISHHPTGK